MLKQCALHYINNTILSQASKLSYMVADLAPNTEQGLFNESSLIIWSGESHNTIYQDASVNWAFRALHDALHLKLGYGFSPDQEIELGRIQASKYTSSLLADLIYIETAGQALHYKNTGSFVTDQVAFTLNRLNMYSNPQSPD